MNTNKLSTYYFYIIILLSSYFVDVCLSYKFSENIIKLVTDGQRDQHLLDNPSFPRLPVKAIYQFGDSLADTGNLIRADPSNDCAIWPYGELLSDKPNGRCSDGLLMIDFFAKFWNIPTIDVYLNNEGNFTHGVNFAVAGATALNTFILEHKYNIHAQTNLSLSVQLDWFKSHLHSYYVDKSDVRVKLSEGLFFMGEIGGNDYNFAFFQGNSLSDVYRMVPDVIQAIKSAVEEIIDLGATQIVVPGNFPIGCVPIYLSLFKTNDSNMYDELKCLKEYNKHAQFHNYQLQKTIVKLQKGHPNVSIVYMDYFGASIEIVQHANLFGFDENAIQVACCGATDNEYKVQMGVYCGTKGAIVCKNPQEHISWDGVHLTQHAYHVLAKQLMHSFNGGVKNVGVFCFLTSIIICLILIWGI
ncbi:hypothetical protein RND81_07G062800 [Saponaria officinalis]|uniref:Uncharacterized protein n=1 Tax=Saponaria officinalis TaxID=3572 RepID=A0AAW1JNV6_SAPOF